MYRINKNIWGVAAILCLIAGCNKDRNANIVLPTFNSQLVVECYLQPGQPYKLLLTESVSYFDPPSAPKVSDAVVTITHNGKTDTLQYFTYIRGTVDTTKLFNFVSNTVVESDFVNPYILNIQDTKGRVVTGTTIMLPPPVIDTIQYYKDPKDTVGYVITHITEDPLKNNYYRYILLDETPTGTYSAQSLYFDQLLSSPDPALLKVGNTILIKSPNEFSPNSTTQHDVQLYHIEQAYYNFLKSVQDARDANGNPFAQPPSIKSNVNGGEGIFTAFTVTEQEVILP